MPKSGEKGKKSEERGTERPRSAEEKGKSWVTWPIVIVLSHRGEEDRRPE